MVLNAVAGPINYSTSQSFPLKTAQPTDALLSEGQRADPIERGQEGCDFRVIDLSFGGVSPADVDRNARECVGTLAGSGILVGICP